MKPRVVGQGQAVPVKNRANTGSFKPGLSGNPAGRPKGSRNKASAAREAEIKASGLTPLEHMLNVLRDEKRSHEDRIDAAKAAAPYVHPRLAQIEQCGELTLSARDEEAAICEELRKRGYRDVGGIWLQGAKPRR